jgi:hypothetical protein
MAQELQTGRKSIADGGRRGGIKIEGLHGLADIGLQLIPAIGLGEDTLAEGFGGIAAIGLLHHFKDEFLHAVRTPSSLPLTS